MPATLTEQTIDCADCEREFVFSIPEQLFYAERGIRQPVRCPECRARRRAERNADVMRSTDGADGPLLWNDGYGNYGGTASPNSKRGPRASSMRMYAAICSLCGRGTEVPFEPRGNRPVYCRECFNARRGR
jgi:CxxC-x17-CxxC domain-containing protein